MAKLCPSLTHHVATNAGDYAELDLLQTLERGLSDAYTLFYSVDWSPGSGLHEQHGEIDIVVVNQAGDVLLIEVKAGDVGITSRTGAVRVINKAMLRPCHASRKLPIWSWRRCGWTGCVPKVLMPVFSVSI